MIKERNYHTYQGYECLSACISNYLKWNNIRIKTSDILFLGDGFSLYYEKNTERILSDMYMSNYSFMKKYHIKYEGHNAENETAAKAILQESILKEKMIMIKVAAEGLEYNRVYRQAGDSQHFLNAIGINDTSVYVSDGFIPSRKFSVFEGWVDLENMMRVWAKKNFDYYIITFPEHFVSDNEIYKMVKHMIILSLTEYVKGLEKEDKVYGYSAIIRLIDNLRDKLLNLNFPLSERTLYLNQQLRVYGFLSSKKMLLEEMLYYGIDENLCNSYKNIVDRWGGWLMTMIKVGFSRRIIDFEKMYLDMLDIIERENELLLLIVTAFRLL